MLNWTWLITQHLHNGISDPRQSSRPGRLLQTQARSGLNVPEQDSCAVLSGYISARALSDWLATRSPVCMCCVNVILTHVGLVCLSFDLCTAKWQSARPVRCVHTSLAFLCERYKPTDGSWQQLHYVLPPWWCSRI